MIAIVAWIALVTPVAAQGSGVRSLLGSGSSSHAVEAEAVLSAASESFADAVGRRLGLGPAEKGAFDDIDTVASERRAEIADEALASFRAAAEHAVSELRGDGVLTSDEVSLALAELRDDRLAALREDVRAEAAGHAPPPRRDDAKSAWEHRRMLLRYILVERNGWRAWATLIGAGIAGFALAVGVLKVSRWKLGERGGGRWKRMLRSVTGALPGPLYLLLAMGGLAIGLRAVWLPSAVHEPTRLVIVFLMVVAVFWSCWRLAASATRRIGDWATPSGETPGEQVLEVVRKLLRVALILVFAILGVELVFDTELTTLVAGLGIIGIAVTLAAQDTLKDFFAALTIHTNRPFALGDLIKLQGYLGTVDEIGFRMTRIRTLDGHLVTVPNAKVVSEPLENVGARPHVRRRFSLDLPYDTPLELIAKAVDLAREVIRDAGDLDPDQEVQVHFDELGPHSLKLLVQYYFGSGDYWAAKAKATEIDMALVERFRAEGIEFAFPTQTLHVVPEEDGVEVLGDGDDDEAVEADDDERS